MASKKPLLDISKVAEHCRRIKAATPEGQAPDFSPVFKCDMSPKGAGPKRAQCFWPKLYATDIDGVELPFDWRGTVTLVGGIAPATQEGLARVNEARGKNNIKLIAKVRNDKQPTLTIGYYEKSPETLEGNSFAIDPTKELPPVSDAGFVYDCLNTWFVLKMNDLKTRGLITDTPVGAAPGALVVASTKVRGAAQTHIMEGPDAGKELVNHLVRLRIKADLKTNLLTDVVIYDGDKMYTDAAGNVLPEVMTIDGNPVTNLNIEHAFPTGSTVSVIVNSSAVCCSSMGLSVPTSVETAVVQRPALRPKADVSDLAGLVAGMTLADPSAVQAAAPAPATAAPTAAPPAVQPAVPPAVQPAAPPVVQPAAPPAVQPAAPPAVQPAAPPAVQPAAPPAVQPAAPPAVQPAAPPAALAQAAYAAAQPQVSVAPPVSMPPVSMPPVSMPPPVAAPAQIAPGSVSSADMTSLLMGAST